MSQMGIKKLASGVYVAYSWTTGVHVRSKTRWVIKTDDDAMAYAMYLKNQGMRDDANAFLDVYCA